MKNTIVSAFVLSIILFSAQAVLAKEQLRLNIRETVQETVEEGKDEGLSPAAIRKNVRENVKAEVKERKEGLLERVKEFVKKKIRFDARVTGTITSIGSNAMTIKGEDGKEYTLNINSATKLVRRFGGKSEVAEFSVGNKVNAFGEFANEEQTVINAKLIRNVSIQKKFGVFFGKVTSIGETSFVIESSNRGTLTVFIEGAKFEQRDEKDMVYGDIKVDHRVRVKGMWDKSTSQITEVKEVKDFSIPAQPVKD